MSVGHVPPASAMSLPTAWMMRLVATPPVLRAGPAEPTRALGFFAETTKPGFGVIAVTVTTVPFEIPIDAWVRATFEDEGWSIVSSFWFPGANGLYFDITGERVVADVLEVRRSSVRVRGGDIFSVNCMCARSLWDHFKESFWVAHATFAVKRASEAPMEPCIQAAAHNPGFKIAHPNSWLSEPVEAPPEGVSALDVRMVDATATELLAYLQVKAVRHEGGAPAVTFGERIEHAIASLERSGFTRSADSQHVLTEEDDPRSIAIEGWRGGVTLTGEITGGAVNVRIGIVDQSNTTVTFTALSPPLRDEPLIALRTQRVFEIARATLEVSF